MAVCGNYKIVANAVKGKEKKEADCNLSEGVYQIISDCSFEKSSKIEVLVLLILQRVNLCVHFTCKFV
jgi:hypothetical protein